MVWDGSGAKEALAQIRGVNPGIKILLSVGGWGADGFSQGSRTAQNREKMAQSAAELVKEYGLDGIDIDWEYPCSSLAGIASDPGDKENFTLLLKAVREGLERSRRRGICLPSRPAGRLFYGSDGHEGSGAVSGLCAAHGL